jgi:hypothetical protein
MGPKFGFGANQKMYLRQSMPQTRWAHFGAFLFCTMMGRKMTCRKGSVFPPEVYVAILGLRNAAETFE